MDLNLQFPAGWENARDIKYSQGFTSPAPRDFVGFGPLTEPEALAIYDFTLMHDFRLVIAFHTQGQEIYWQFQNYNPPQSFEIGTELANVSGYRLAETPYNSSFAGFKDWFIQNYNRPGYTIEAGIGVNPLPISQFDEIYQDNLGILVLGAVCPTYSPIKSHLCASTKFALSESNFISENIFPIILATVVFPVPGFPKKHICSIGIFPLTFAIFK